MAALAEARRRRGSRSSPANSATSLPPPFFLLFSATRTGEDGAAVKHAASSGIIQQFDTFIVSRLIYGSQTELTFL